MPSIDQLLSVFAPGVTLDIPADQVALPDQKLTILGRGVLTVFSRLAMDENAQTDDSMIDVLMPVLEQGLQILTRKAASLPDAVRSDIERQLARLLAALANGLDDPSVTPQEYAARIQETMSRSETPAI